MPDADDIKLAMSKIEDRLEQNPGDPAATAGVVADAIAESNNQLSALLGDANYADYRNEERTQGQSSTILRLSDALVGTQPLNDSQTDQLQQLLGRGGSG